MLCQSLDNVEYFDCELPRIRRLMDDPETFLDGLPGKRVVLDEIHRLGNPSELLKIAADHYPDVRVIATGSSTLGASARFRDTLTGRKTELWLTPMIAGDLEVFGGNTLDHRLHRGGLPPFFLAGDYPERDFQEWMDAYWAKDIQEMFRLERRHSFQKFVELVMAHSGGLFEASRYAQPCEVSRTTISNFLATLEATMVAHVVRPYSSRRSSEIVAAPKVYGFDTGFVCYYRGWHSLRSDDMGLLWEHFVLNEIHAQTQDRPIQYWRDKRGHEVDFILARAGQSPLAIECKWSSTTDFEPSSLLTFRKHYPEGRNYVVSRDVKRRHRRRYGDVEVSHVGLADLIADIA